MSEVVHVPTNTAKVEFAKLAASTCALGDALGEISAGIFILKKDENENEEMIEEIRDVHA